MTQHKYPDAHITLLPDGRWELAHVSSKVSVHPTRDEAYDRLQELRESAANGEEGCLSCGS